MAASTAARTSTGEQVTLRVPADAAYLGVVRTAAAGLGARLDLTLDELEDLRIAVDEACALLLDPDPPASGTTSDQLTAVFTLEADGLSVRISGPSRTLPDQDTFAWAVLEALVGDVQSGSDGPSGSYVELRHVRREIAR